jgi:hypothetical protein
MKIDDGAVQFHFEPQNGFAERDRHNRITSVARE